METEWKLHVFIEHFSAINVKFWRVINEDTVSTVFGPDIIQRLSNICPIEIHDNDVLFKT